MGRKRERLKYCSDCGLVMTKEDRKHNEDICQRCATAYAEDADREMYGDDYDTLNTMGYFEDK